MSKVIVITGATSGIGRAVALRLAREGGNLMLVGRNVRRGSEIAQRIQQTTPSAARFLRADLSTKKDVERLATAIQHEFGHVDILINNAGARFDTYGETEEGIERTFATNHLGHFLLTNLLLEHLKQAPAARIITVTSSAHAAAKQDGRWSYAKHEYDRRQAYAKSKLANILFAFELSRRLTETEIASNAVDPGVTATRFALNNGLTAWTKHLVSHAITGSLQSASSAADTVVYVATCDELAGVSGFLFRQRQVVAAAAVWGRSLSTNLWNESAELTGFGARPRKFDKRLCSKCLFFGTLKCSHLP